MIQNQRINKIAIHTFLKLHESYKNVHVDIGTGDGKYIYRKAKKDPKTFFVGMDSSAERMSRMAWRAERKPEKGGISNIVFLYLPADEMPKELPRFANHITILYPWSRLLKDLIEPSSYTLKKIAQIATRKCKIEIALNYTVFEKEDYIKKLGLPRIDHNYIEKILRPKYKENSLDIKKYEIIDKPLESTWGKHLGIASQRKTLYIQLGVLM
jgi:16S rRNA (adenine(1408)-N(1))-methyltransferase